MEFEDILLEVDEMGVACITLNRPEAMNTLSGQLSHEWNEALKWCDANEAVRVIIMTGSGKAFCAGADLTGGGATFDIQDDMSFSSCPIIPPYKLKKPVIAAINGHALGVGLSMAMQSDFKIAALEGKYGLLQVQRGVLGDGNMHWLLPRLVGMEKALQFHLLGEKVDGKTLAELGLVMKAVPAEDVLKEARALAQHLAVKCSPLIVGLAKQLCWQSWDKSMDEMEKLETRMLHYSMGKHDAIEGGTAFAERRAPQWTSSVNRDWPEELGGVNP